MATESSGGAQFPKLGEIKKLVEQLLAQMKEKGDTSLMARVVDYELKIQALTEENKRLKSNPSVGDPVILQEAEKVKQELFQLQEHYRTLYDYYQQVTKENEQLKARLVESAAVKDAVKVAELEATVKKLEEENRRLKDEIEKGALGKKVAELEEGVKKLYSINRSLKEELEKAKAAASQAVTDEGSKKRIEELERSLEGERRRAEEYKTKLEAIEKGEKKEGERELLEGLKKENIALKEELERVKAMAGQAMTEEGSKKKIEELQRFFEQARQEAEAYRKMAEENRKELLRLRGVEAEYNKYKDLVEEVKKAMEAKKSAGKKEK
ncbi:MAG: hypothetical protein N2234_03000 [Planctomycetota bacterium]|nr:hypothetical protein [Planctomycetota bacterium]